MLSSLLVKLLQVTQEVTEVLSRVEGATPAGETCIAAGLTAPGMPALLSTAGCAASSCLNESKKTNWGKGCRLQSTLECLSWAIYTEGLKERPLYETHLLFRGIAEPTDAAWLGREKISCVLNSAWKALHKTKQLYAVASNETTGKRHVPGRSGH